MHSPADGLVSRVNKSYSESKCQDSSACPWDLLLFLYLTWCPADGATVCFFSPGSDNRLRNSEAAIIIFTPRAQSRKTTWSLRETQRKSHDHQIYYSKGKSIIIIPESGLAECGGIWWGSRSETNSKQEREKRSRVFSVVDGPVECAWEWALAW